MDRGGTQRDTIPRPLRLKEPAIPLRINDDRTPEDAAILASVTLTHRAVVVDEGWRSGSLSAEVSARITEQAFFDLDAPVARVCSAEVPIPYAKHLELAALPSEAKIVAAAKMTVDTSG